MLNLHSCFSLRYGTVHPEQLVGWIETAGYDRVAFTDINTTSALLGYVRLMRQKKRQAVVGVDFRNGVDCCFVGIAKNNEGLLELNRFLSEHLHHEHPFPARAPQFEHCYVIYPWEKQPAELRPYERIGIAVHQLNRLRVQQPADRQQYVALQPMTFLDKQQFNTHRLLRAIDCNTLLSTLSPQEQTRPDELLLNKQQLYGLFGEYTDLLYNAEMLLNDCSVTFGFDEEVLPQNLATYTGDKEGDFRKIAELCYLNLPRRYPNADQTVHDRINKELEVIRQKDYLSYFLIAWDIVSYANGKGYFYVGRGSGANSIVAYLLGITDVDPIELDLYFERFINLYRKNPPDFDIDFSWRDRDDVTEYIFRRFPNSAMICTYNTFQYRATIRELGKIMGLPKSSIDQLSAEKPSYDRSDKLGKLILKYSKLIAGLPSYLSVHAGGIIISEKPVHYYTATFLTSKNFPTTQFSMLEAEDVGFYKFDILSQRGLGKIKDCLAIIHANQPENPPHDIRDIHHFKHDDKVNSLLRKAQALGCFYVESPGMRMLMTKLKTNGYLELVAASSIIRPGVAQSGMMREYILRHRHPERRADSAPKLLELMPDTYGVMVYQEDVIKVANQFAGLSLEEADILRRAMSGKYRSRVEFTMVRDQFFRNCLERGYKPDYIQSIWLQIESFGGFAFSKGHSASYAVESYQSLYLKAYYPLEYMVATINNFGGFYRTEIYVREAEKLGATIESPCINKSDYQTTIRGSEIHLGFQHIEGLEQKVIQAILSERAENGPFLSLEDLTRRVTVPIEQLSLIIRINALRSFGTAKKALLWEAHLYQHKKPVQPKVQASLFEGPRKAFELPELKENPLENAFEQMELLGFPLCNPFELVGQELKPHLKASETAAYSGKEVTMYGYHVNTKRTSTKGGESMLFGTFLDSEGDNIDTVHFPDAAAAYPFRGGGIYELTGTITSEFDFQTLEVATMKKINYRPDVRYADDQAFNDFPT
ncbi:MAG TPA: DNA polymerase III subunit alpha [Fluviicola sp.]|nr:DNA polymerase III subunit alpha [Fluviicola sp.]